MNLYVLDTSVVLKLLLKEEDSDKVKKIFFLKEQFQISVFVPDLFRYEFFNKVMRFTDAIQAVKAFNSFVKRQVSIIPLDRNLSEEANKLMEKYNKISFYDAAYHALAKVYKAILVTADEKYYEMTKGEGNIELLKNLKI